MKKSLSILLALIMVLSTVSVGVFALDETAPADANDGSVQTEEQADGSDVQNEDADTDADADADVQNDDSDADTDADTDADADADVDEENSDADEDADAEEAAEEADGDAVSEDAAAEKDGDKDDPLADLTITAEKKSKYTATVKWDKAVKDAESYKVVAYLDGEKTDTFVKVGSSARSANVSGLNKKGTYTFKLRAYGEDGQIGDGKMADGSMVVEYDRIDTPKNLKSYSGYQSVALEWTAVSGAKGYYVYRGSKKIATVKPSSKAYDSKKIAYIDKGRDDGPVKKTYTYRVAAYDENTVSEKTAKVEDSAVRQMYIKAKFNQTAQLTSHDGKNKKHTFHSGDTIYATGYSMGKYHFYYEINGKSYLFYTMYGRLSGISAKYTKAFNYSTKEAEYFAKTCGKYSKSSTKYLIWVNLYTQHVYIMKKTDGNWRINKTLKYNGKVYSNWEVSSGTAHTPSPWGLGLKFHGKLTNIYNRKATFPGHGANLWNFYHSETALHGPAGNTGYGVPHSHGCIRNPQENALFLFNKIPLKTRVIIF